MSIKTIWLDHREIKVLREHLQYVASQELLEEIDEYLTTNDGAYICNMLSDYGLIELESLNDDYDLGPLTWKESVIEYEKYF